MRDGVLDPRGKGLGGPFLPLSFPFDISSRHIYDVMTYS